MSQAKNIPGIHHVTAIATDPQQNFQFYTEVLGLRFVKRTVNFDDKYTYHLYYGDEVGHPGTVLTFFPWPNAMPGQRGFGTADTTAFLVPPDSLDYWINRLDTNDVDYSEPTRRFDEQVLGFTDPDGLRLELVGHRGATTSEPWHESPVPADHAIRGFYGVTLALEGYEQTADLLENTMGYEYVGDENGQRFRYQSTGADLGTVIDLHCVPNLQPGRVGTGMVHHIAYRTADDDEQLEWREDLIERGLNVTPVIDRQYFHSIYYRIPAGVLFEIATDPPGFTKDEPVEELGSTLKLPPWFEPEREAIKARLPEL
ncbi:ring-cleaving dioxygenase [Haladaptatus salinisoli]|uniref:ring-cleaving dioxygenase n=1 Tax=Haladaptatus salinisoli TaxID=2884876 RepID=UPI001D0B05CD|nr:ring-cleaving dioxygenase [Haladaptatus salinisoli]